MRIFAAFWPTVELYVEFLHKKSWPIFSISKSKNLNYIKNDNLPKIEPTLSLQALKDFM